MAKLSNKTKKYVSPKGLPLFLIVFLASAAFCLIYISSTDVVTNFPSENLHHQLNCDKGMAAKKLITNYPLTSISENPPNDACAEYFRWIHEDLRPWKSSGIQREVMESAKDFANFKLVIVNGKVYVEKYRNAFETRDLFTIWGILQLLRLYPGRVPDLELMFNCADRPGEEYGNNQSHNAVLPPVLFQYCKREDEVGVLFPDWTFWGWAEVNVKPWKNMIEGILEGNKKTKWKDRQPFAYWRGNPYVNYIRPKLMKCNVSHKYDWNARLYRQKWDTEAKQGYKNSKLEDQCTHRYKIFVEGWGWSVSEKYILACDSMVLLVKPHFYDFFSRSLMPMQHYWHIRTRNLCRDIKFAVEWGNNHTHKAQEIGEAGSKFIEENLKMKMVYDYMFHVLNEYAKLLKFKPRIPQGAEEVLPEKMACLQDGLWRKFMMESSVNSSGQQLPCTLPPPYSSHTLHAIHKTKHTNIRKQETWSDQYWDRLNMTGEILI